MLKFRNFIKEGMDNKGTAISSETIGSYYKQMTPEFIKNFVSKISKDANDNRIDSIFNLIHEHPGLRYDKKYEEIRNMLKTHPHEDISKVANIMLK